MPISKNKIKLPNFLKQRKFHKQPGLAPGTLTFHGDQKIDDVEMELFDFDEAQFGHYELNEIDDSRQYLESPSKTWINVKGLHRIEVLQKIWSYFDLHPLVQEDILNTQQRSKIEEYDNNVFFVLRMFNYVDDDSDLNVEQVSIVLGKNYVLSFQETDYPIFDPVIARITKGAPRLRNEGTDYSAYALIDTIVDHYYNVLESVGEEIESLEERILEDKENNISEMIHATRRKLMFFRKSIWPLKDSLNSLIRDPSPFINEQNKIYYRDVHDHLTQVIDGIDNYREMVMGLRDMYMSQVSNRMNEVMKVLTIIATIFIPLTFVAGIYGMNFESMPELKWEWGYTAVWVIMALISTGMVIYFKKKRWL